MQIVSLRNSLHRISKPTNETNLHEMPEPIFWERNLCKGDKLHEMLEPVF